MGGLLYSIKVFFNYWMNLLVWNREGWYIGDYPSSESQQFRIMTRQKVYREHTCKMCKRKFWSYKNPSVCFRMECYLTFYRRKYATNTCKN